MYEIFGSTLAALSAGDTLSDLIVDAPCLVEMFTIVQNLSEVPNFISTFESREKWLPV